MLTKAPKGTKDVLPQDSYRWHYVENIIRKLCGRFGYNELRTPVFEHTELFLRGVGDTTDIVQKEMYTFEDKGGRSITLKPEGTAGAARSYIENHLYAGPQPIKMYYLTPVFRYERPQAGRLREHHQFGVEVFGADAASIDAEIIMLAMTLFNQLGIEGLELNINSIGCKECRPKYYEALKGYFDNKKDKLCKTCQERLEKNPLRILDCKVDSCREIIKDAPLVLDYLCNECSSHFERLKKYLESSGLDFKINPFIVRGLDYYTRTVFEIISTGIGAQGTVCGGGRYNALVEECGGPSTPGVGFGLGLERLLLVLEQQSITIPDDEGVQAFIVSIGDKASEAAFSLIQEIRLNGMYADMDHTGRSVKAQFKYANKINASYVIVIGSDELESGKVRIKNMQTGEEKEILIKQIVKYLKEERMK